MTAWLIPLITAFIAAITVVAGAIVTRSATHYSARLHADQRRRDVELAVLDECRNALLDAADAVQSYTFEVDDETRLTPNITPERFSEIRPIIEPAVVKAQRLQFLIPALPWDHIAAALTEASDLLQATLVIQESEGDIWKEAMDNQPNPIVVALTAVATHRRHLLETYPVNVRRSRRA
ncbi:hypothetical protein [Rhodococcus pyridinivorans]|uniref:hypothetical protein n=1 Tax=Rhodococcus pyridinivorans TaxID=103816 RepID=UPI002283E163|nr:hypothetical protein [Rhodococcus pyridinivorans]WAL49298.1 hypothetical protein OQN32_24380 [Rhodococcus pyridinivorans]